MSDQIFYYLSAILLGLVIGALIMYFANGSNKDSDKTIANLEKELEDYQHDVADHFEQTADLVDDMTKSYKKVFDHLGKSARLLMTEEQIQKQLELRKGNKVTLEYLTESNDENQKPDDSNDADQEDLNSIAQVEDAPVLPQNENENDSEIETIDDTSNAPDETMIEEPENNHEGNELLDDNADELDKVEEKNDSDEEADSAPDDKDSFSEDDALEKEVKMREKNIYN